MFPFPLSDEALEDAGIVGNVFLSLFFKLYPDIGIQLDIEINRDRFLLTIGPLN